MMIFSIAGFASAGMLLALGLVLWYSRLRNRPLMLFLLIGVGACLGIQAILLLWNLGRPVSEFPFLHYTAFCQFAGAATLCIPAFFVVRKNQKTAEKSPGIPIGTNQLAPIINDMPVMIDALDENGNIVFWNRECERVTGYLAQEIVRNPKAFDILYPDKEYLERKLDEWKEIGFKYQDWEWELTCKNGEKRTVAWTNATHLLKVEGWEQWGIGIDVTEHKVAKRRFQEERIKLLTILENIGDLAAAMDEDYNILFMSGKFVNEFGDGTGKKCYEVFCGLDEPCKVNCAVDEIIKNRRDSFQYSHSEDEVIESGRIRGRVAQNNLHRVVETIARPIYHQGKRCVLEVSQNVTERRAAEKKLQHTKDHLQAVLDAVPACVSWVGADLKYRGINKFLSRLLKIDADEIVGKEIGYLGADPEFPRFVKEFFATTHRTQSAVTEFIVDGEINHFLLYGQKYLDGNEAVFIGLNITEQRKAESARNLQSTAIEQAAEAIIVADSEGIIEYVNPAFERITGYSSTEAIGMNAKMMIVGKHDIEFYHEIKGTVQSGNVWSGRITSKHKDGSYFQVEITISPVRNSAGGITNYVAVMRDITQEAALEAQLQQAQKMQAIGQLAGGIAHDFNNILQAITGYTQLAMLGLPTDEKRYRDLEEVRKSAERASSLVRQLLTFSRRQIAQTTALDLNEVIVDMVKMLRRVIGEDIALEVHLAKDMSTICADRGMIEQVIMNLCVNSRDAMPHGGNLVLETDELLLDADLCLQHDGAEPGRYAKLSVRDNGDGMAPDVLEHLFEPFFTTKEIGKGTGLGLATVYGIVRQHDGFVDVISRPGSGARFDVYLPVKECTIEDVCDQPDQSIRRGTGTVLLAEDEKVVRDLSARILSENGYSVIEANDGEQALRQFHERQHDIDLIILDMVMPKMSGVAVFDRVRAENPKAKVLFMSGYSTDSSRLTGGIDARVKTLQKPCPPELLLRTVADMLE